MGRGIFLQKVIGCDLCNNVGHERGPLCSDGDYPEISGGHPFVVLRSNCEAFHVFSFSSRTGLGPKKARTFLHGPV